MQNITVDGLTFVPYLDEQKILNRIKNIAQSLSAEYEAANPIFLCVLNGSFFFSAELLRELNFAYEISFVRVKSYDGVHSANEVKEFIGLNHAIEGRHIIILEDIVESGLTTHYLLDKLNAQGPTSIAICTLLYKPQLLKYQDLPVKFVGFEIDDAFVIGFGLDYNDKCRNLRAIYQLHRD